MTIDEKIFKDKNNFYVKVNDAYIPVGEVTADELKNISYYKDEMKNRISMALKDPILQVDKSVKIRYFLHLFYVLNGLKIALKDLLFDYFLLFFL